LPLIARPVLPDRDAPPPGRACTPGTVGWPLSLGLQLVEIEALARIDRRRSRRWAALATVLMGVAGALAVLGPAVTTTATAMPAIAFGLGAVSAGALAVRRACSAHRRDADAFNRQLRHGHAPASVP
jgi:hypothetical protein